MIPATLWMIPSGSGLAAAQAGIIAAPAARSQATAAAIAKPGGAPYRAGAVGAGPASPGQPQSGWFSAAPPFFPALNMNKAVLIQRIVAGLHASFAGLEKAARAAHAEATHESSKADNKYDTRGLEASYLARGQAQQAEEILAALQAYEVLPTRAFGPGERIGLTALVRMETDGTRATYFIGPTSGGLEIECDGEEIMVITPSSPLGRSLMGKQAGQRWTTKLGAATAHYHILSVE